MDRYAISIAFWTRLPSRIPQRPEKSEPCWSRAMIWASIRLTAYEEANRFSATGFTSSRIWNLERERRWPGKKLIEPSYDTKRSRLSRSDFRLTGLEPPTAL